MNNLKKCFLLFFLLTFCLNSYAQHMAQIADEPTWTFTYLKANGQHKIKLREFLEKNWMIMDSIAVTQGLFKKYELIENQSSNGVVEWDYMIAVEYFTKSTYTAVAEEFELIRKNHKTIRVDGLGISDLGKIMKSETVRKIRQHLL